MDAVLEVVWDGRQAPAWGRGGVSLAQKGHHLQHKGVPNTRTNAISVAAPNGSTNTHADSKAIGVSNGISNTCAYPKPVAAPHPCANAACGLQAVTMVGMESVQLTMWWRCSQAHAHSCAAA